MKPKGLTIASEIIKKYRKIQKNTITKTRSPTIHVTDLTASCHRKIWYNFHRESKRKITSREVGNFYLGTLVHQSIILSDRNEVEVSGNVRTMQHIPIDKINKKNFFDCVTGSIDDIVEIDGQPVIVDKKTTSKMKIEPDEQYVAQLNIYKLLLYLTEGTDVKKGAILYLNKYDSFSTPICFEIDLDDITTIRKYVTKVLDIIKGEKTPDRTITPLCDWCPHLKECDPYENGGRPLRQR